MLQLSFKHLNHKVCAQSENHQEIWSIRADTKLHLALSFTCTDILAKPCLLHPSNSPLQKKFDRLAKAILSAKVNSCTSRARSRIERRKLKPHRYKLKLLTRLVTKVSTPLRKTGDVEESAKLPKRKEKEHLPTYEDRDLFTKGLNLFNSIKFTTQNSKLRSSKKIAKDSRKKEILQPVEAEALNSYARNH